MRTPLGRASEAPAGGIGRTCLNASEAQGDAVADRRVAVGALHEHGLRRADAVEVLDGGGAVFGELAFVIAEARDPGLGPSAGERMAPERLNHLLDRVDDRGDAGHGPHRGRNPARMGVNVAERGQNRASLEVDGRHAVVRGCAGAGTDPGDAARLDEKGVRVGEAFAVVNDGIVNEDVVHGSPALKLKGIQKGYGSRRRTSPEIWRALVRRHAVSGKERRRREGQGKEKAKKMDVPKNVHFLDDLAGVVGFEPTNVGFRIRCLNRTWRYPSTSGAVGETRTLMALTTATSTLRVYQFRHDRGPNCSPLMCIRRSEVTSRGGVFYLGISFVGALLGFSLPDIPYSWDAGCSTVDKTPPAG